VRAAIAAAASRDASFCAPVARTECVDVKMGPVRDSAKKAPCALRTGPTSLRVAAVLGVVVQRREKVPRLAVRGEQDAQRVRRARRGHGRVARGAEKLHDDDARNLIKSALTARSAA
jgi:hypothetical protein